MKIACAALAISLTLLAPAAARACEECAHRGAHHEHAASAAPPAATTPLSAGEARVTIPVSGMHCSHCADRVVAALRAVPGVQRADASLEKGEAVVAFDKAKVKPAKLKEAIDALGFHAGEPVQN